MVERQTLVWIWMGDPAQADPAKIVDIPYLANPAWRGKQVYLHYDANYDKDLPPTKACVNVV